MELWIRSQDKESLTKVSNISLKEIRKSYTNEFECYGIGTYYDNLQVLGKYKTKERALEVLDEIQNLLQPKIIYTQQEPIETYELGVYQLKQNVDMEIEEVNTIVYEMPEN